MQNVVIEEPYTFVPPRYSRFWHRLLRLAVLPRLMRKQDGVLKVECVGVENLRASLAAGHGVLIVANHCRPSDPMVLDVVAAEVRRPFRVIASWHAFMAGKLQRFVLQRVGGFSVYREGMDRESLKCAVATLVDARFPLVVFAEGIITRSNDRLANFMEGPSFMARTAAKQRGEAGKVVIHPVFIRYFFEGDLEQTLTPVVEDIERRLSWQVQSQLPLRERIHKIGTALMGLKEMEYLHAPQSGTLRERLQRLEDHLLEPIEIQWCAGRHDGDTTARVKRLRSAILPDMVGGNLPETERAARLRHLADLYLVQQLRSYPGGYLEDPTPERVLETVERYEEDLTDVSRPHSPMRAVVTVGKAIEVAATRDKSQPGDPVTVAVRKEMEALLEASKAHRKVVPTNSDIM